MDYENQTPIYEKPPKKRRWPWVLGAIVLAIGLGAAMHWCNFPAIHVEKTEHGFSIYLGRDAHLQEQQEQETSVPASAPLGSGITLEISPSEQGLPQIPSPNGKSLQEIYTAVLPSVVTVTTHAYGGTGYGTGVIMSEEGYIITNRHVIENATAISVQLHDGTVCTAAVVGSDAPSDLAVLKVEAQNLTAAPFGDSDSLRVGDLAVAIGSPLGPELQGTMTNGIISGISRDLTISGRKMTLLQTNAALNRGNSGGPLVNCYGQVVGVCVAKLQGSGFSGSVEGLGFAIPMAAVKPIVDDLISQGYVTGRPAIGIVAESLPLRARIYFGLPEGAHVTQVDPASDAYSKGLRPGDIITAFNGESIRDPQDLTTRRDACQAGDTVTITVFRDGQTADLSIVLMDQVLDE